MAVRAEVPSPLPLGPTHHLRPRPLLADRYGEVGVRLVVPVPDVEAGPIRLDQVVLEHQGVHLARRDYPFDGLGLLEHGFRAGVLGLRPVGREPLA